jgi:hypothetical protein
VREEKIVKNKRVKEDNMGTEESGGVSKRQRLDEQSSASGIENPLVPYNDVDDEEEDFERGRTANGGGRVEENRGQVVAAENGEEEEEEEEDLYGEENSLEKRKSQFEPRADCPYLDTVNRQVKIASFLDNLCRFWVYKLLNVLSIGGFGYDNMDFCLNKVICILLCKNALRICFLGVFCVFVLKCVEGCALLDNLCSDLYVCRYKCVKGFIFLGCICEFLCVIMCT